MAKLNTQTSLKLYLKLKVRGLTLWFTVYKKFELKKQIKIIEDEMYEGKKIVLGEKEFT